ncbi:MAG: M16 family metallopeptidase [Cytophagaceae bacterium]
MIDYKSFTLDNGLEVYVHEDHTSPVAVLNLLYKVGSKDEEEHRTGFAHLFEHLMFGGSLNIPSYDQELERAGGENNAFTSPDITNYYITIPSANIETAFWLESDRMLSLSFDQKVLDVQKSVVVEEFKQRYLNQPYGDVWLKLRPLAYQKHPYKWPTIGKEIAHIETAVMDDVRSFFKRYYIPNNAILVVAGDISFDRAKQLTEKWFGPISIGPAVQRNIPSEPIQSAPRKLETEASVPLNALYKVYHMPAKGHPDYYASDLLSDIVGRGKSSLLYQKLVKEKRIFNSVSCYVTGSADPGLLVIEGKLNEDVSCKKGEEEVEAIIDNILVNGISEKELQKVKNQAESSHAFGEVDLLNRAMNLAFASFLGDSEMVNKEAEKIQEVAKEDVDRLGRYILRKDNCSTLYYHAKK